MEEGQSQEERSFLLSELALELYRVKPCEVRGYLPAARIGVAIREVIEELREKAELGLDGKSDNLKDYVHKVFETVLK